FKVFLPRVIVLAPAVDSAPNIPELPRGSETILLVEDEELVRHLARTVLEQQGYQVVEARHSQEALQLWKGRGGRFDLLLTDVVMPGGSGRALAEQLESLAPGLRV